MSNIFNEIEPDSGPKPPGPLPSDAQVPLPVDSASPEIPGVWRRRLTIISHFFAGQAIVQFLNFLVGFLLLRWMTIETYAQYSVAWAFQSTVGSLVDLGFTGSIVALVGHRANQPDVVGRYVRTARHFRIRSFIFVTIVASFIYPYAVWHQQWGWQVKTLLYIGIVAGLAAQNLVMYASVLLMARQIKPYYRAQIASSIWRQTAYAVMYYTNTLTSWSASWISATAIATYGFLYRKYARPLIQEPVRADPEVNREMLRYIAPLVPAMVFAAFQGQLTVAVITVFGKTKNIAEVSALGRLSQLFLLMLVFNSVILEPYLARISREELPKRFFQVILGQVLVGLIISSFAFMFPGVLLLLLGPKYAHLRNQVGWVAVTSSIEYVTLGIWMTCAARKWIYWWCTGIYISLVILTQITFGRVFDMSTTSGVIYFDLATNIAIMVVQIINVTFGFLYGPPKTAAKAPSTAIGT